MFIKVMAVQRFFTFNSYGNLVHTHLVNLVQCIKQKCPLVFTLAGRYILVYSNMMENESKREADYEYKVKLA